ncbi:MAG: PQQ-binding-like beta-propeller repeat protein [Pirellulaceae bacterium]|nr:PQQ-binding-like beta-propeller repeat protein [Pirellulaceae bacterium]
MRIAHAGFESPGEPDCQVFRHDGNTTYRMWWTTRRYEAQKKTGEDRWSSHVSVSTDGLTFRYERGPEFSRGVFTNRTDRDLIRLRNGNWRAYTLIGGGNPWYSIDSFLSGKEARHWNPERGVRIRFGQQGDWDFTAARAPEAVLLPNGGVRVYYIGWNGSQGPYPRRPGPNERWRILSAVSRDGLRFEKEPGVRMDVDREANPPHGAVTMAKPLVVRLSDGRWRMYFAARPHGELKPYGPSWLFSAVSKDGLNWERESGVRVRNTADDPLEAKGPSLVRAASGKLRLYYDGRGGIRSAAEAGAEDEIGAAETNDFKPSDWRQFRGDRGLTGRSILQGHIVKPSIEWRHFIGQRETLLTVRFDEKGSRQQTLPTEDLAADRYNAIRAEWNEGGPWFDLEGDGRKSAGRQTPFHKLGDFLPQRPGLEKLEFESAFLKPSPPWSPAVPYFGRLFVRKDGRWRQAWQTKSISYLFLANPIVGDFDNDQRLEVAVVPHDNLLVFDVTSGEEKYRARFTPEGASSGRSYGYLGGHDLDDDGRHEFVMISTFESHIDVLGWKDGKLQALWSRVVEAGINRKETILHVPAGPVRDLDGDGRFDIAVSVFNSHGDGRWRVEVMDALTGMVKLDLPEQHLDGFADLDQDGVAELLCSRTNGRLMPRATELSALSIRNGQAVTRWKIAEQAFANRHNARRPLHENESMPDACGMAVLSAAENSKSRPIFVTKGSVDPSRKIDELSIWQAKDGDIKRIGRLRGPDLEALAIRFNSDPRGELLLRTRCEDSAVNSLESVGAKVDPLLSHRVGGNLGPAVAARLRPRGPVSVVVPAAGFQVKAIDITGDPKRPTRTRWTTSGRDSFPVDVRQRGLTRAGRHLADSGGPTLADLTGSGELGTIVAARGGFGELRVRAVAADGGEIWRRDFNEAGGGQKDFVYLQAGKLTSRRRDDVLVTIQPGHLHSEITVLLDGRTGEEIWRRSAGGLAGNKRRACGGNPFALDDWDGDGLDDIVCLFPDVIYVMQGSTGDILLDRWTPHVFGSQALYAAPVIADFLDNGRKQILFAGCTSRLSLLDRESTPIWQVVAPQAAQGTLPSIPPGVGDFDGDGRLELFSLAQRVHPQSLDQQLVCYQAIDGKVRWQLPLPGSTYGPNGQRYAGSPTAPCTGDIDGDGRDECIFTIEDTLYAVGSNIEGTSGAIEWFIELPGRLSSPVIADTDRTGQARIVVVCADGNVYCIGPATGEKN